MPIKSTTTTEEGKKEKKKKAKSIHKYLQKKLKKIRIINVFHEALLSESFPSLGVTVYLTSLGCLPTLC